MPSRRRAGISPDDTPEAEIMHVGGASAPKGVRMLQNWTSKTTQIRGHWPKAMAPIGLFELWLACATRALASAAISKLKGPSQRTDDWLMMWEKRQEWLKGY